jgi:PadR family transcriptional regulator, regulatory protein PadR
MAFDTRRPAVSRDVVELSGSFCQTPDASILQTYTTCGKARKFVTTKKTELLKGTLDLLILRTLDLQPLHGVAIAERIRQVTGGTFAVQAGSLFPALHRLEVEGWIAGEWHMNDDGRRVKSYRLTAAGRRKLSAERRLWERIVAAVGQVLEDT